MALVNQKPVQTGFYLVPVAVVTSHSLYPQGSGIKTNGGMYRRIITTRKEEPE